MSEPSNKRSFFSAKRFATIRKKLGDHMGYSALELAATGTLFTFLMTTLGAATVFLFKKEPSALFTKLSLGFAAGIMIAASVWSLLIPAIENCEEQGHVASYPVPLGFILGVAFLIALDNLMPHLHPGAKNAEGPKSSMPKESLLFMAVTIHNIPEGMAVGIAFAAAANIGTPEAISAAIALALGMGIQNIPEGTAVTLPMYVQGKSKIKAFLMGSFSGLVEPIAAIITVALAANVTGIMPYLLSFSAGAMLYVVVEELIPEAHLGEHSDIGTIFVMLGFLLMMILDTSLG